MARDAYEAVGFESMWEDGTCEVEEGLFSQSVEFSDVSYQSARREDQEACFSAWRALLDSFGEDAALQVSVTNVPLLAEEVGNRSFFPESDPATAPLAREYNRILNDKMREGVSNIVRRRWLTFSVGAESADAAAPRLARVRSEVTRSLGRMRSEATAMDGMARLSAMAPLLRPGRALSGDYSALGAPGGMRAKDLVCPTSIDRRPEGSATKLRVSGAWCQTLVMRSFGSELSDRCVAELVDLPMPMSVSLHVRGMDRSRAVEYVKRRLAWMDKEVVDEQAAAARRGYGYGVLPAELRHSREEAEDLLDHLQNRNQRLFRYTGLVHVWADTEGELDRRVDQAMRAARSASIDLDTLDFRQLEGLNSVLPLGNDHVGPTRLMTTAQVAVQMPFATMELSQPGGATTARAARAPTSSSATGSPSRAPWATWRASPAAASPSR